MIRRTWRRNKEEEEELTDKSEVDEACVCRGTEELDATLIHAGVGEGEPLEGERGSLPRHRQHAALRSDVLQELWHPPIVAVGEEGEGAVRREPKSEIRVK